MREREKPQFPIPTHASLSLSRNQNPLQFSSSIQSLPKFKFQGLCNCNCNCNGGSPIPQFTESVDSRVDSLCRNMASLLKFKLLPTHCGVAQSPTLSPRTSPLVHLRRRKTTLRMFLTRNSGRRSPRRRALPDKKRDDKDLARSNTLKDLFVSSPPYDGGEDGTKAAESQSPTPVRKEKKDGEVGPVGWQPGSPRPVWTGFRYRYLLRKTWRPVLAGIPE